MSNIDPLAGYYVEEEEVKAVSEEDDPLAAYYVDETPEKTEDELYAAAAGPYKTEEKTPEQLKSMSMQEKREYADALNLEREYVFSKGFTKGALSGATIGATENIEALKPKEGEVGGAFGQLVGSTLPISKLIGWFGKPLVAIAQKSPYFKKSLESLAHLTGVGLGGAAYSGTEKAFKEHELPSTNDLLEHGFEWAALDAMLNAVGKAGAFAVNLVKASRKTQQPAWKLVNEVNTQLKDAGIDISTDQRAGAKALSILEEISEANPKEPTSTREVTQKQFKAMEDSIDSLSEPILPEAREESLNVNSIVQDVEKEAVANRIDSVGRKAVNDTDLGKDIQEGINKARAQAKASYRPLYEEVDEKAQFIFVNPEETPEISGDLIQTLETLRTQPAKYATVIKTLEDILKDTGFKITRNKGAIESILREKDMPLSNLIELGRRLNEIVEYDVLDYTVKDRLKPVVKAVKRDIRAGLKNESEDLLASFELAEEAHGLNERKFNRDSIRKIRSTEALESIPKQVESATTLQDLSSILTPSQMKNVERDLLEKMNRMTQSKAEDFLRKISAGLSPESRFIAEDIIRSKRPLSQQPIQGRRDRLKDAIVNDLSQAMHTGQRPKKALELWQNPRGQKLVKESLQGHPQRKELINYMEKQTFHDMAKSILSKEGTIDFQKLKDMMDNPAIRNNLKDLGGQEAVDFFNQLSERAKGLKKNTQELVTEKLGTKKGQKITPEERADKASIDKTRKEKGERILKRMVEADYPLAAKIQKALDLIGFTGKVTLNMFTLIKFGFLKGAMLPISTRVLQRMATDSNVRKAFMKASKRQTDSTEFLASVEALGKAIDEGSSEDEY